ncbi:MAG: cyclic nucleotide-binding domain-containing protein, partial [Nitrospira sp.]
MSKRPKKSSKQPPAEQSGEHVPAGLDRNPLLQIFSDQDRHEILRELTETRYGKGQYIFREGDPTEYFHIVKEGTVKCFKSSPGGKECMLKVLMPGDLFCCDAATFDGAYHPGTAQPMSEVSVLRMRKEAYFDMLR